MKKIYSFLLRSLGWTSSVDVAIPSKCVICVAPHTSNWDFIIGMIFYKSIDGDPHFLMKKSWFFFPLNYVFKALGGIPVDRGKNTSLTGQMADEFHKRNHFQLAIAPEGTRQSNPNWKTGFYYIALEAQVPIILAYLDYAKKTIGIFESFMPTGNAEEDIDKIKSFYANIQGKKPEQFTIE